MSSKQLYLHIGTNKAASTSLQSFFKYFNALEGNHHYLADEYRLGNDVAGEHRDSERMQRVFKQRITRKIEESPRDHVIISSENFWTPLRQGDETITRKVVDNTRQLTAETPTRLLIVFRRQDTYLESGYTWRVKAVKNYRDTFESYLDKLNPDAFDWLRNTLYWEQAFGRENVHVVPFELLKQDNKLFSQRIMRFLNIRVDDDFEVEFPRSNTGISAEGVRFAMEQPAIIKTKEEQRNFRKMLEREYPVSQGTKPIFFSQDARESFMAPYAESNKALLMRYGYGQSIWGL